MKRSLFILGLLSLCAFDAPEQFAFERCVADPAPYLAMDFQRFDQAVEPTAGERRESGWREIAAVKGCETAAADLIRAWRMQHAGSLAPAVRAFMAFHEGQIRASGGDHPGAVPLIEEGRPAWQGDAGQAYVDANLAFLRGDREALLAARERLLAVPEPENWPETQRTLKEQFGQDMRWPLNIEATDLLVACFGLLYPGGVNGGCGPEDAPSE